MILCVYYFLKISILRVFMDSFRKIFSGIFFFFMVIGFFYAYQADFFLFKTNEGLKKNSKDFTCLNQDFLQNQLINIKNDVLSLDINLLGGSIERANLLQYKDSMEKHKPFTLLKNYKKFKYKIIDKFFLNHSKDMFNNLLIPKYRVSSVLFRLQPQKNLLKVYLTARTETGILYTKIFSLSRGSYNVGIEIRINNFSVKKLKTIIFSELQQTNNLSERKNIIDKIFHLKTYRGSVYSSDDIKYKKYSFDISKKNFSLHKFTKNGWIAMIQQYFVTALIPKLTDFYTIYTNRLNNISIIGFYTSIKKILPNDSYAIRENIWIGPEVQNKLVSIANYLDLVVDYGWFWFIAKPLFTLLTFCYKFCNNWGIAIILVTLFMKIITYPLTKSQYLSAIKIKKLQPKLDIIKKKFLNDTQKMSQEILSLYKKSNINPISGILPVILQMPIFLSLYYVLISSIELRHAPFILWIKDLSSYDPFYILPILLGITMFLVQISSDNFTFHYKKQKIKYFMPMILILFFLWFPSGLVLYYIVSNFITVLQQYLVYYSFNKKK